MLNKKLIAYRLRKIASDLENSKRIEIDNLDDFEKIKNFSGHLVVKDINGEAALEGDFSNLTIEISNCYNPDVFKATSAKIDAMHMCRECKYTQGNRITHGSWGEIQWRDTNISFRDKVDLDYAYFENCTINDISERYEGIYECYFENCTISNLQSIYDKWGGTEEQATDNGGWFKNCTDGKKKFDDFYLNYEKQPLHKSLPFLKN